MIYPFSQARLNPDGGIKFPISTIQDFDGLAYGASGSGFSSGGGVLAADMARDVTVDYQYDSAGRLADQIAYDANGTTVTPEQTSYLHQAPVNASLQTGVIYPDATLPANFFQAVTQLTQSGGTATATVPGHGYNTGDWVCISGAAQGDYDGWVQITKIDADHFSFAVASTAAATGNIQVHAFGADVTTTDYNRLGQVTVASDQRGVTHKYTYDPAGRVLTDQVTSFGPASQNVDPGVDADHDRLRRPGPRPVGHQLRRGR